MGIRNPLHDREPQTGAIAATAIGAPEPFEDLGTPLRWHPWPVVIDDQLRPILASREK
tara:strand:- start:336 stop:509 length:174 start_codon:yes stop_codon:yes gene_type:complete